MLASWFDITRSFIVIMLLLSKPWKLTYKLPSVIVKLQNNEQNNVLTALFTSLVNIYEHITGFFCHFTFVSTSIWFVLKVLITQLFVRYVVWARMGSEHARARHWPRAARSDGGSRLRGRAPRPARQGCPCAAAHRYSDCDDNVPIYVFGHGWWP